MLPQFVSATPLETKLFIAVICALAVWMNYRFTERTAVLGPTVLTMLGILGCFLGIALGLWNFNPADIQTGVPALVHGIKLSFWVSVAGISCALILKLRVLWGGIPESSDGEDEDNEEAGVAAIVQLLKQLNQSFDGFAVKISELGSKALVQALADVIQNFNEKLTQQLGSNFAHLNSAIEQMVVWQQQYREQLTLLITQENMTCKNMAGAADRYADLIERAEIFTSIAEQLSELLEALNSQRNQIEQSMHSLGQLLEKAGDGLPRIETLIVEYAQQMQSGVQRSAEIMQKAVETTASNLSVAQTQMQGMMLDGLQRANQEMEGHIKQLSEDTRKQVVALNAGMERALTQSLETLGRQLTALSQRFVDDYAPLVEQLRRITHVVEEA